MDTEKLRELEREMRVEASHSDEKDADALNAWADRLRDILAAQPPKAELGQEVGAVPNGKLVGWWNGITPGFDGMGVPSVRWGADAENSRHDIPLYDGYNPIHYVTPPSSPAHTSEARELTDAMVEAALDAQPFTADNVSHRVWQLVSQALTDEERRTMMRAALDAAMRQEAE